MHDLRLLKRVEKGETSHKAKGEKESLYESLPLPKLCPKKRMFPIASRTGSKRKTTPRMRMTVPAARRMSPILGLSENRLSILESIS